jgi:hypothetical protein
MGPGQYLNITPAACEESKGLLVDFYESQGVYRVGGAQWMCLDTLDGTSSANGIVVIATCNASSATQRSVHPKAWCSGTT